MPVAAAESQHPFAVYRVLHSANQVLSRHSPANKSELRMNYGSMYWQYTHELWQHVLANKQRRVSMVLPIYVHECVSLE